MYLRVKYRTIYPTTSSCFSCQCMKLWNAPITGRSSFWADILHPTKFIFVLQSRVLYNIVMYSTLEYTLGLLKYIVILCTCFAFILCSHGARYVPVWCKARKPLKMHCLRWKCVCNNKQELHEVGTECPFTSWYLTYLQCYYGVPHVKNHYPYLHLAT